MSGGFVFGFYFLVKGALVRMSSVRVAVAMIISGGWLFLFNNKCFSSKKHACN
jgi:hypothetical protein